jgi:hypothetical protein
MTDADSQEFGTAPGHGIDDDAGRQERVELRTKASVRESRVLYSATTVAA